VLTLFSIGVHLSTNREAAELPKGTPVQGCGVPTTNLRDSRRKSVLFTREV